MIKIKRSCEKQQKIGPQIRHKSWNTKKIFFLKNLLLCNIHKKGENKRVNTLFSHKKIIDNLYEDMV